MPEGDRERPGDVGLEPREAKPGEPIRRLFHEGEVLWLRAVIVKTHDDSNHIVDCAGERMTPSRNGLEVAALSPEWDKKVEMALAGEAVSTPRPMDEPQA